MDGRSTLRSTRQALSRDLGNNRTAKAPPEFHPRKSRTEQAKPPAYEVASYLGAYGGRLPSELLAQEVQLPADGDRSEGTVFAWACLWRGRWPANR
jgi:hypothetical protein